MNQRLRAAIRCEWENSRVAAAAGELDTAFRHLERAHILSQRLTGMHVRTHLAMLALGWRRREAREVLGQLSRTLAAACFSRIWVPLGNTGGANVSAFKPMPVPKDLEAILRDQTSSGHDRA
jgi:hypothetical protein